MFPKFQTPMHLKIDLDQVHFTELRIFKKSLVNNNNKKHTHTRTKHKSDFYHQALSQSLLSQ